MQLQLEVLGVCHCGPSGAVDSCAAPHPAPGWFLGGDRLPRLRRRLRGSSGRRRRSPIGQRHSVLADGDVSCSQLLRWRCLGCHWCSSGSCCRLRFFVAAGCHASAWSGRSCRRARCCTLAPAGTGGLGAPPLAESVSTAGDRAVLILFSCMRTSDTRRAPGDRAVPGLGAALRRKHARARRRARRMQLHDIRPPGHQLRRGERAVLCLCSTSIG